MLEPLDERQPSHVHFVEAAEIPGQGAGLALDPVAADILEQVVVGVHAVEGGVRRMRLVQVTEQVVDEVGQRFRSDHDGVILGPGSMRQRFGANRQWYNKPGVRVSRRSPMSGTLFVVATPIGNLEDITLRALRVLREVALVAAEDTRRTAHLLARYDISTPTISLREHNESQKAGALIERLLDGQDIALVSDAGTPTVSDPGQWLVRSAIVANIRVESVPGPSAVLAGLSASGFVSDTFLFLGFPPVRSKDRKYWMERLAGVEDIVIFFEAPHRIRETLEQLQAFLGDRTVVVGRELTKIHEELVRGPISVVLDHLQAPKGEFVVVVDIGHKTELAQIKPLADLDAYVEFSRLTSTGGLPRRRAINAIARKYQMAPNLVYAAIERGKILGKQQNSA